MSAPPSLPLPVENGLPPHPGEPGPAVSARTPPGPRPAPARPGPCCDFLIARTPAWCRRECLLTRLGSAVSRSAHVRGTGGHAPRCTLGGRHTASMSSMLVSRISHSGFAVLEPTQLRHDLFIACFRNRNVDGAVWGRTELTQLPSSQTQSPDMCRLRSSEIPPHPVERGRHRGELTS